MKYEIFLLGNTKFFLPKVLALLNFESWQNGMSSVNLVKEIHLKLLNERALSSGEPCTCEYVTLFQSFYRGALSIYWYIAQTFQLTFFMSVLFTCTFETALFSRFLKVAIAMSKFMNEVYDGRFASEYKVSMSKEIIVLVWDYFNETRK